MYKTLVSAMLIWLSGNIYACDVCGCSAGGNYFGILPRFQQNFVGIRHHSRSFNSKSPHQGLEENESNQYFNTSELWGRFNINKHLQLFAFVPYNTNKRVETNKTIFVKGLGDISGIANFVILNSDSTCKKVKHLLQMGAGIKVPTGKYDIVQNGLMLNQNMQLGSGSFDFPFNAIYTLRYMNFGINTELNYTINSANKQFYKFGNRASASCRLFYWQKIKRFIILPSIGAALEKAQRDEVNSEKQEFTGGQSILANTGFDLYYQNISFGITMKTPIIENIAGGYVHNNHRISANFIYLF